MENDWTRFGKNSCAPLYWRSHGFKDGVCSITHAGLEWQETGRNKSPLHFVGQKIGNISADLVCDWGGFTKSLDFIGNIGVDNADNLLGINLDCGDADAIVDMALREAANVQVGEGVDAKKKGVFQQGQRERGDADRFRNEDDQPCIPLFATRFPERWIG